MDTDVKIFGRGELTPANSEALIADLEVKDIHWLGPSDTRS